MALVILFGFAHLRTITIDYAIWYRLISRPERICFFVFSFFLHTSKTIGFDEKKKIQRSCIKCAYLIQIHRIWCSLSLAYVVDGVDIQFVYMTQQSRHAESESERKTNNKRIILHSISKRSQSTVATLFTNSPWIDFCIRFQYLCHLHKVAE